MGDKSVARFGGTAAILVGISYIVVAITYFILPAEQRAGGGGTTSDFLSSVATGSTVLLIQYWVLALSALLAIAVVAAVSDRVRSANEGLVRWTSTLAILGFAVLAIQFTIFQDHTPQLAAGYVQSDESTQAALSIMGPRGLDPDGWMGFGTVGLWVFVVNWLALGGGQLPRGLAYVGLAAGVAYALVVAGFALDLAPLIAIAVGVGGAILGPIWYIWTGTVLRRGVAQTI